MTSLKGRRLRLTVNGASHAQRIDFSLSGLPAGFLVDDRKLAEFMERRAPGRDKLSTARRESDAVHWTQPGCGYILNENVRPGDYGAERTVPRPGHADFPQFVRFGRIPTGGGENSGRLTAAYCAAGGVCLQYLESRGVSVAAKIVRCGDIEKAKKAGDSVGGVIECEVKGVPVGLGGAMFDGLDGEISKAVFGIPGVKGIEFGNGFAACDLKGSQNNDAFVVRNGEVRTRTNNHGGILGGYTSGMPIVFRVAMKPTPTVFSEQDSVDLKTMKSAKLAMKGRHDPCIVRRAVPVVEAMVAFAIADAIIDREERYPRVCLTLTGKTVAEDLAQYMSQKLFTDMVELRIDLLERGEISAAMDFPARLAKVAGYTVPVLVTCRRKCDGGAWAGSEKSRASLLKKLIRAFTAPLFNFNSGLQLYLDLESDFHELDGFAKKCGVRIVRSTHCFDEKSSKALLKKFSAATSRRCEDEILKLAIKCDLLNAVALIKRSRGCPHDHVVMAMGYEGFFTRALAAQSRSKWVYTSVGGLSELGHVTPSELVRDFRFHDYDSDAISADLFGVTGWPLKKTRSPELHNAAFFAESKNALMVSIPCPDIRKSLQAMKDLGMIGLAVTIPHKEKVISLLDRIDPVAKAVGAVNTVLRCGDRFYGYNTDVAGFTRALVEFVTNSPFPVPHSPFPAMRVALLGAGGAAKACKYALRKLGCKVTVFHRRSLTDGFDLIVNATPVDPIPEYVFRGDELVYDLRYVPETTELMARAAKAGCRVCNGFSMLRYQAEEQRKIWYGDMERSRGILNIVSYCKEVES